MSPEGLVGDRGLPIFPLAMPDSITKLSNRQGSGSEAFKATAASRWWPCCSVTDVVLRVAEGHRGEISAWINGEIFAGSTMRSTFTLRGKLFGCSASLQRVSVYLFNHLEVHLIHHHKSKAAFALILEEDSHL